MSLSDDDDSDSKQIDRVEQNHACDPQAAKPSAKKKRNRKPAPFTQTDLRRACQVAARFGNSWRVTLTTADGGTVTVESGSYRLASNVEGDTGALDTWMAKHARKT
jgi:hypothetical protein